jgi:GT2 family glycosyltransferase
MKAITLIIPNYNGAHLLRRNLPSALKAAHEYRGSANILVVDDGSTDSTCQILETEFPEIQVARHEQNMGFADSIMTGVRRADTELVFLLNSDVELYQADVLNHLAPYFNDESTFSVNPLILNENYSANQHSWNLRDFHHGYLKLLPWNLDVAKHARRESQLPTLYTSGGSMLMSREKFLALGGFDPIYKPFYGEDFDLGIRAWYRGWHSYFEPETSVVHQAQGSIKDAFRRKHVLKIRRRNRYLIQWIHNPFLQLFTTWPFSLMRLLGELVTIDRTNLAGFLMAITQLPKALSSRIKANNGRKQSLQTVLSKIKAGYPRKP